MNSIRVRLNRIVKALESRRKDAKAEALRMANDLVQFQVEAEILDEWVDEPRLPVDPRQAILAIVEIWKRHAQAMGVPNDGTVERRIVGIYRHRIRSGVVKEPEGSGSLVEKLAS